MVNGSTQSSISLIQPAVGQPQHNGQSVGQLSRDKGSRVALRRRNDAGTISGPKRSGQQSRLSGKSGKSPSASTLKRNPSATKKQHAAGLRTTLSNKAVASKTGSAYPDRSKIDQLKKKYGRAAAQPEAKIEPREDLYERDSQLVQLESQLDTARLTGTPMSNGGLESLKTAPRDSVNGGEDTEYLRYEAELDELRRMKQ